MTSFRVFQGLSALSLMVAIGLGAASAAAQAPTRIAVVDTQRAIMETEDGLRAQATLKKVFDSRQRELDKKQDDLQKEREDIEKQKDVVSKAALAKRIDKWQREMVQLQQVFVEYNKELQKKQNELTAPIFQKAMGLIRRDAADEAHGLLEDRGGELVLLLLELFVVLDEDLLELDHLALPLVDALGEGGLADDVLLLLDVLALFLQVVLLLVELALAAVEHLLQRGLSAEAVFGLHDRALRVDDRDARRGLRGGRCGSETYGNHQRERGQTLKHANRRRGPGGGPPPRARSGGPAARKRPASSPRPR